MFLISKIEYILTIIKFNQHPTYSDIVRLGSMYKIDDIQLVYEFTSEFRRISEDLYILYKGMEYQICRTFACGDECESSIHRL